MLENTTLSGTGPWWVGLPGSKNTDRKDWGTGYRALIIRDYKVQANGKTYINPTIRAPVFPANPRNIDIELVLPSGVSKLIEGDIIELDLELITLHRCAEDYYGPNQAYINHLRESANSWKTIHREAAGNDLKVVVLGVDSENRKINLGLKQCVENPWPALAEKYPVGHEMEAEVVQNSNYGVFVKLEDQATVFEAS